MVSTVFYLMLIFFKVIFGGVLPREFNSIEEHLSNLEQNQKEISTNDFIRVLNDVADDHDVELVNDEVPTKDEISSPNPGESSHLIENDLLSSEGIPDKVVTNETVDLRSFETSTNEIKNNGSFLKTISNISEEIGKISDGITIPNLEFNSLNEHTSQILEVTLNISESSPEHEIKSDNNTTESISQTLLSSSSLEFLLNSELAKNAAGALEIFNFSDPLSDHIIEENEFHSFLTDTTQHSVSEMNASEASELSRGEEKDLTKNLNETINGDEVRENQLIGKDTVQFNNVTVQVRNVDKVENETKDIKSLDENSESNKENSTGTEKVQTENKSVDWLIDDLSWKLNVSSEAMNFTQTLNSTDSGISKCPSPGFCFFSFLSQDACAEDEHCLDSRICCKVGCSKVCLEPPSDSS